MCGILPPESGQDMTQPDDADIGRQFKEAAERLGFSQQKLAKMTGMSRRHIAWIFQGGNAGVDKIIALMRALSMTSLAVGNHAVMGDHPEQANRVALRHAIAEIQDALNTFVVTTNAQLDTLRQAFGTTKKPPTSETGRRAAQLVKEVTATARRAKSTAMAGALRTELTDAVDRAEEIERPARGVRRPR